MNQKYPSLNCGGYNLTLIKIYPNFVITKKIKYEKSNVIFPFGNLTNEL